jgi:hypothetical protein
MELANVVTEDTLGKLLSIKPATLYSWRRKRLIPYMKKGKFVRYDVAEVKKWLTASTVKPLA